MRVKWACAAACLGSLVGFVPMTSASARALGRAERAEATAEPRVAVLPVESRSTLPDSIRQELRGTIAKGLRRADVELVSDALVDRATGAKPCEDAGCAAEVAEGLDAAWVVRATVTRVDAVYEVWLEAVDVRGRTLASVRERCEICGQDEVTELVVDRSAALASKVRLLERQAPRLVLRSQPSGAKVWIDDRLVGRTPLAHEVTAGQHEVRMELRGHASARQRVTAVAGTEETLELELRDVPGAGDGSRRGPWRALGGTAVGLGAAMVGAGVALAAIDERDYERRCNPDPLGHCSQRYDTLEGGIALAVSGGVLVVSGVVALVLDRRSRRADSNRAVRWRVDRGLAIAF